MRLITKVISLAYDRGLTLCELADKAGVKRSMIYDWSRHTDPRISSVVKVAKALEVSLDELMEGVDIPEQSKE